MEEHKTNPLAPFILASMLIGSVGGPFNREVRKSKFDVEPTVPKPHNRPEPKEHTHGLEPKPRPARKVFREKLRNGDISDYFEKYGKKECSVQGEEQEDKR